MAQYDANMQELVKWIISIYSDDELFATNASNLRILQDEDFTSCLRGVMYINQVILRRRWTKFLEENKYQILSSHESYISHIVFAFRMEEYLHLNIFERFLIVCAIAILLCIEIYYMTEVKLINLSFDIIMMYYEKNLKKSFEKRGGFQRLVDHIRDHKYARWGKIPKIIQSCDPAERIVRKEMLEKLQKEFKNKNFHLFTHNNAVKEMEIAESLAREFLPKTKIMLLPLPNRSELEKNIKKMEQVAKRKLDKVEREMYIKTGFEPPAFFQLHPLDSAAKECTSEEGKMEDSAKSQQTEVEQKMDHLDEAVQGLSISNSDCKPKLDVKLSEFEEAKGDTTTERKPTAEMVQKQQDIDEDLPCLQISNPGSKPNEEVEQETKSARSQKAEEATRNKESKSSRKLSAIRSNQMQLIETLEHLNGSIKSLIEVLDQYDKE